MWEDEALVSMNNEFLLSGRRHLVNLGHFGRSHELRVARWDKTTFRVSAGVFQSNEKLQICPQNVVQENTMACNERCIVTALQILCCTRRSTILRSVAAASRHFGETRVFSLATGTHVRL